MIIYNVFSNKLLFKTYLKSIEMLSNVVCLAINLKLQLSFWGGYKAYQSRATTQSLHTSNLVYYPTMYGEKQIAHLSQL